MPTRYVLIGNSAAALEAIRGIRKHDREGAITVINREEGPAYSRVALPYYVAGEMTLNDLLIRQRPDYGSLGASLVEKENVTAIDAAGKKVMLASGKKVEFDKLLIGTGSETIKPPIQGLDQVPHHYLWTLDDAIGMKKAAEKAQTAVVIGGGFIGMLAAEALRKLKIKLTIVEMAPILLPQLLDEGAGKLFLQAVRDEGVTVRTDALVSALAKKGDAIEVTLKDGTTFTVDMAVVATGVKPHVQCVSNGAVTVNKGIVVNEYLASNHPDIYAAGDVAETKDFLSADRSIYAIWPTAVEQGRAAGANMAGAKQVYPGGLGMNVVELFNVTLAQLGRFREGAGDDVKMLNQGGDGLYRKVVVDKNGTLVGAVYLGNENGAAEMGVIHSAIKRREKWQGFQDGRPPVFTYASVMHRVPRY
ncbi:MAG: NAD(P)/FAD-dependent oxidoreductase [Deltaproteobacteria bacterium]|nr:NAD(P)/FAD-dependent oxidoreductase [Deltaproteobacteria bacterium]